MQTMLEFGMKFMSFEKHKSVVAVEKHKSAKRSKTWNWSFQRDILENELNRISWILAIELVAEGLSL